MHFLGFGNFDETSWGFPWSCQGSMEVVKSTMCVFLFPPCTKTGQTFKANQGISKQIIVFQTVLGFVLSSIFTWQLYTQAQGRKNDRHRVSALCRVWHGFEWALPTWQCISTFRKIKNHPNAHQRRHIAVKITRNHSTLQNPSKPLQIFPNPPNPQKSSPIFPNHQKSPETFPKPKPPPQPPQNLPEAFNHDLNTYFRNPKHSMFKCNSATVCFCFSQAPCYILKVLISPHSSLLLEQILLGSYRQPSFSAPNSNKSLAISREPFSATLDRGRSPGTTKPPVISSWYWSCLY